MNSFNPNKQYKVGDMFEVLFDNKIIDMIILDINEDKSYIVQSKCVLEERIFDENTNKWKDSSIRKYLNSDEFINRFDKEFTKHILESEVSTEDYVTKDKFYLLSHEEVNREDKYGWFKSNKGTKKLAYFSNDLSRTKYDLNYIKKCY